MRLFPSIAILAMSAVSANAAIVVTSSATLNFDNLNTDFGGNYNATGGSSAFPTASDPAGTSIVTIYSDNGTASLTVSGDDFNPGGIYSNTGTYSNSNSFRALSDGGSSDLALGVKDSTDRTFRLRLTNGTASPQSVWNVSYDVEQYSRGGSATLFKLTYSTDGSSFVTTNLSGGADVAAVTGTDGNLATVASTARTAVITETIAPGADLYLQWTYDHQSTTSLHMGLDNITVAIPEPATLGLLGLAGLAMGRRRR